MKRNVKTLTTLVAGMMIGASTLTMFSFKGLDDKATVKERVVVKKVYMEDQNHGQLQYKWNAPDMPQNLTFAGEKVPLERTDVKEQLDRELMYNYYNQTSTAFVLKMANRWFPIIEPILAANGVPDDFKYLCVAESALKNQTSPVGAVGFWQIMPRTAPEYGLEVRAEVDERYNVAKSTEAAAKYLKQAYQRFNSWTAAAASYNMGQGGLNGKSKAQLTKDYYSLQLSDETMRYVHRILAFKLLIGNPEQYGFRIEEHDVYEPLKTRIVAVTSSIPSLASFAKKMGTSYKKLKELNPWLREERLTVKAGKSYQIQLPMS
ncbi:MAG: lytic transglycosylase domain-containing protein [Sphingobacteriales bacterium]|nr:MAG: lytic transglycosylase domain-containing protein [Sphingobacteriales bacterium]